MVYLNARVQERLFGLPASSALVCLCSVRVSVLLSLGVASIGCAAPKRSSLISESLVLCR